jgi:hypothetical protein
MWWRTSWLPLAADQSMLIVDLDGYPRLTVHKHNVMWEAVDVIRAWSVADVVEAWLHAIDRGWTQWAPDPADPLGGCWDGNGLEPLYLRVSGLI